MECYASNAALADSTAGLNLGPTTHAHTLMEKHTCLLWTLITSDGKFMNHNLAADISQQIPTSGIESAPVWDWHTYPETVSLCSHESLFSRVPAWCVGCFAI